MKRFGLVGILMIIITLAGCGGSRAKVEPVSPAVPEMPRLDIPPDAQMFRVVRVIEKYGSRTVSHGSYAQYQKAGRQSGNDALNTDIFYDRYLLDLNEKNYWVTVTLHTAVRAMRNDPRIKTAMEGLPRESIDVVLKTPDEKTFVLSDTDANGVLDFAGPADSSGKALATGDINLLRNMQSKYRWILGIIKRYYRF